MQRSLVSLIIGFVLAVVAVALLFNYIGDLESEVAQPVLPVTTGVVVAAEDLPFGATIQPQSLRLVNWPQDSIPSGAFTSLEEVFEGVEESGDRVALGTLVTGEPILRTRISGFGERPILSRQVSEGMRAISIRIDDVSGVAGFVLPGDRVDILLTRQDETIEDLMVTDIILQNVVILGIDQSANQQTEEPIVARAATVEVTPEQAQKLALAQRTGNLSLALRGVTSIEEGEEDTLQVDEYDLDTGRQQGPVLPTVRVRSGNAAPVTTTVRP